MLLPFLFFGCGAPPNETCVPAGIYWQAQELCQLVGKIEECYPHLVPIQLYDCTTPTPYPTYPHNPKAEGRL